jgi:hypothetical protein
MVKLMSSSTFSNSNMSCNNSSLGESRFNPHWLPSHSIKLKIFCTITIKMKQSWFVLLFKLSDGDWPKHERREPKNRLFTHICTTICLSAMKKS